MPVEIDRCLVPRVGALDRLDKKRRDALRSKQAFQPLEYFPLAALRDEWQRVDVARA